MGNYLKMPYKRRVLALLELGWSYRRIERETGVRRETVARYDPRREPNAANLSTGSESASDELADGESKADNLSAGSSHAHGPPGVAAPYRAQIEFPIDTSDLIDRRCLNAYLSWPLLPRLRLAAFRCPATREACHSRPCLWRTCGERRAHERWKSRLP